MDPALAALRRKLTTEMPVTQRLGIRLLGFLRGGARLHAPLAANINHLGTAFAGSLNAVATLAGWATVWLLLRRRGHGAHVVIQDSSVRYLAPVYSDAVARCSAPDSALLERALATFGRRGLARLTLSAEIAQDGAPAMTFQGRYVFHRRGVLPSRRTSSRE